MRVGTKIRVIVPICALYLTSNLDSLETSESQLSSELVYGDHADVIEARGHSLLVVLCDDGYQGWIHSDSCIEVEKFANNPKSSLMRIRSPAVNITTLPSVKSESVITLYMGSTVEVLEIKSDYSKILVYVNGILREGFIPSISLRKYNKASAWVDAAERYMGSPYKWGGSTHAGIDCSALVQKCLWSVGRRIPRDTSKILSEHNDLFKAIYQENISIRRGMLIFWRGHVAICIDQDRILHSNAYHAAVEVESFSEASVRIAGHTGDPVGYFEEDFIERLEHVD